MQKIVKICINNAVNFFTFIELDAGANATGGL